MFATKDDQERWLEARLPRRRATRAVAGRLFDFLEAFDAHEELIADAPLGLCTVGHEGASCVEFGTMLPFVARMAAVTKRSLRVTHAEMCAALGLSMQAIARLSKVAGSAQGALALNLAKLPRELQLDAIERFERTSASASTVRAQRDLRAFAKHKAGWRANRRRGALLAADIPERRWPWVADIPVTRDNFELAIERARALLPPSTSSAVTVGETAAQSPKRCGTCGGSVFHASARSLRSRYTLSGGHPPFGWLAEGHSRYLEIPILPQLAGHEERAPPPTASRRLLPRRQWPIELALRRCARCSGVGAESRLIDAADRTHLEVEIGRDTPRARSLLVTHYAASNDVPRGLVVFELAGAVSLVFPTGGTRVPSVHSLGTLAIEGRTTALGGVSPGVSSRDPTAPLPEDLSGRRSVLPLSLLTLW